MDAELVRAGGPSFVWPCRLAWSHTRFALLCSGSALLCCLCVRAHFFPALHCATCARRSPAHLSQLRLQEQLAAVQMQDVAHRLSERSCVEIILKLLETQQIEVCVLFV